MAYATVQELKDLGLPPQAVEELTDPLILEQLELTAGVIDLYLGSRYALPLLEPYPKALVRANIDLAICEILLWRGINPEVYDSTYFTRCKEWKAMLEDISSGKISLPGVVDPTPEVNESAPRVATNTIRGWTRDCGCDYD